MGSVTWAFNGASVSPGRKGWMGCMMILRKSVREERYAASSVNATCVERLSYKKVANCFM
jgi:hypothetical protein